MEELIYSCDVNEVDEKNDLNTKLKRLVTPNKKFKSLISQVNKK